MNGHLYEKIEEGIHTGTSTPRSRLGAGRQPLENQHYVPDYPPPTLQNQRQFEEEASDDWHTRRYLGPSFPSLEREVDDQVILPRGPRDLKVEQLELQDLLKRKLQDIHKLEDNISFKIYGTRKEAPVSLLDNQEVIYATEDPSLFAPDTRTQISGMKRVLEMMNNAKTHHLEILSKLNDQPVPIPRQSSRLQNKDRLDYRRMNNEGY